MSLQVVTAAGFGERGGASAWQLVRRGPGRRGRWVESFLGVSLRSPGGSSSHMGPDGGPGGAGGRRLAISEMLSWIFILDLTAWNSASLRLVSQIGIIKLLCYWFVCLSTCSHLLTLS